MKKKKYLTLIKELEAIKQRVSNLEATDINPQATDITTETSLNEALFRIEKMDYAIKKMAGLIRKTELSFPISTTIITSFDYQKWGYIASSIDEKIRRTKRVIKCYDTAIDERLQANEKPLLYARIYELKNTPKP